MDGQFLFSLFEQIAGIRNIYIYSTKFVRFANAIDLSTLHNILYYFWKKI